jgi:hypothetical protein
MLLLCRMENKGGGEVVVIGGIVVIGVLDYK